MLIKLLNRKITNLSSTSVGQNLLNNLQVYKKISTKLTLHKNGKKSFRN